MKMNALTEINSPGWQGTNTGFFALQPVAADGADASLLNWIASYNCLGI
jgi:hypothetical protein